MDIGYSVLVIGYSPASRDPAGRDGILSLSMSLVLSRLSFVFYLASVLLDIGYSPAGRDIGY